MLIRRPFRGLLILTCVVTSSSALAQPRQAGSRPIEVSGATIHTMGSRGIVQNGTLVVRDGKIRAVRTGSRRRPGRSRAEKIDATGMVVTPGLIDAWSSLGLTPGGSPSAGRPSLNAAHCLNPYERHLFEEAIRQGVTSICIEPTARRGMAGASALVRLEDLDDLGATTTETVNLVARVGIGQVRPLARLGEIKSLRRLFDDAKTYREEWEDYEEKLEEYVKSLKEGKAVKLKKPDKKKSAEKPQRPQRQFPRRGRRGRRPRPRPRPSEESFSATESVQEWLDSQCICCGFPKDTCGCPEEPHEDHDELDHDPTLIPFEEWFALSEEDKKEAEKKKKDTDKKKKDDDDLEKPSRPARDPDKEILVKALKREVPVRFEAHRPADILNVLELIDVFKLDAMITGASGATYVADELEAAGIPVVFGQLIPSAGFDNSHTRDLTADAPARLSGKVDLQVLSSGRGSGSASHYLSQAAAIAVGHGLDEEEALRAITFNAAKACGASDTLGSLEAGKLADFVIWSGPPLEADSVVEYVFIGGKEVYRRGA